MYELKNNGKVFTSKSFGTGPSSYGKKIYLPAVSQNLRNTGLHFHLFQQSFYRGFLWHSDTVRDPIARTVFPNIISNYRYSFKRSSWTKIWHPLYGRWFRRDQKTRFIRPLFFRQTARCPVRYDRYVAVQTESRVSAQRTVTPAKLFGVDSRVWRPTGAACCWTYGVRQHRVRKLDVQHTAYKKPSRRIKTISDKDINDRFPCRWIFVLKWLRNPPCISYHYTFGGGIIFFFNFSTPCI